MKIETLPKPPKAAPFRPALRGGNIYKRGPDKFGSVAYYVYAKDDQKLINLETGAYWRNVDYGTNLYDADMLWEDVTDRFVLVERS